MQYAFCKVSISPLRSEASDASEMVSQLLFGELLEVLSVEKNWTKIRTYADNYEAWMDSKQLIYLSPKEAKRWMDGLGNLEELLLEIECPWGNQFITKGAFLPDAEVQTFQIGNHTFNFVKERRIQKYELSDFAKSYLNTPYLWGGKSPFGIDCSGFTQNVFRHMQINLPRDAYQQCELGVTVPFEEMNCGDLAFFHNDKGRITHVGIVLDEHKIIHASGWVRIDNLREDGIYKANSEEKTHTLNCIKRL